MVHAYTCSICKLSVTLLVHISYIQPLDYGNSTYVVQLPIEFEVSYSGINITSGRSTVMASPYSFSLPAVDGSVIVNVQAFNDFGVGGLSLAVEDIISKISVCVIEGVNEKKGKYALHASVT